MSTQPSEASAAGGPEPRSARVGPYTLLAKIGEGGMGVVHLARRDDLMAGGGPAARPQRVALKMLRPHIVGDDEARQRLAREVSSLGRVRSRWVAEIVDADPWAVVPYVATRYVPGYSLHDHVLHEGPVAGADLLWLAACLGEGLAAVHAAGVLHRDVKPSNVLMEGRTPILIDFGLARVADDPRLTHTGWLLGTPGYLAPEILYGDDASPASDLHSWAATVAYAAIGRAPFGRGPAMAVMDRVRRGEHDLSGLAGPLREVVVAALDPEPDRRPTLDAVLAWLRPQTTRPAPVVVAPPERRRAPATAAPPERPDPFADALRLVAPAGEGPAGEGPVDRATVVLPEERPPVAPAAVPAAVPTAVPTLVERRPAPPAPPAPTPVPAPAPSPAAWHPAPPGPAQVPMVLWPEPPRPVPVGERLRRLALVAGGALATGSAVAVAPWVALAVLVVAVWLLRSGSLAASAVDRRRWARGRRWYDGVQLVLAAPWHLLQAVPGAVLLLLWAGGLAVSVVLVCYAAAAAVPLTLFLAGTVLALGLWSGPGGSRVRGPLGRVVDPASHRPVPWLAAVAAVLLVAGLTGAWAEATGPTWTPASEQPFAGR